MARKKAVLVAYLQDGDAEREVQVEILNFDRIKGERTGPSMGLSPSLEGSQLQYSTLYLFHALHRVGEYDGSWRDFQERDLLDFDPVKDTGDVDPTQPAPTTEPLSSSPTTSVGDLSSGSTPMTV